MCSSQPNRFCGLELRTQQFRTADEKKNITAKHDHQRIAEPTRLPKAQRPAGATTSAILSRERRAEAQSAASRFGASPEARR
jgi:hypothetical protein